MLRFQPLSSAIHISFWQELSRRKLEVLRLSKDPVRIRGSVRVASDPRLPGQLEVSGDSFLSAATASTNTGSVADTGEPTAPSAVAAEPPPPAALSEDDKNTSKVAREAASPAFFSVPGELHIVNTREEFKRVDKRAMLSAAARRIWSSSTDPCTMDAREL